LVNIVQHLRHRDLQSLCDGRQTAKCRIRLAAIDQSGNHVSALERGRIDITVKRRAPDRHANLCEASFTRNVIAWRAPRLNYRVIEALKALLKQPYWVVALVIGAVLLALPCVTVDKEYHWATHPPNTVLPAVAGIALLVLSAAAFALTLWPTLSPSENADAGLDLSRVKEVDGVLSTTVGECEVRVVEGRLEDYASKSGLVVVLPCNEYFDDECAGDVRSALGAYVNRVFEGQVDRFISLMKDECQRKLGPGAMQQKTHEESSRSFGAGRCVLLLRPLGRTSPVALVSTTTQRAGRGLSAQISYLFMGMHDLATRLADARLNEVAMPVLGAGHGGIAAPLAFVGTLLAVAEAATRGEGGQRLRMATIVVFKQDADTPCQVDRVVLKRALALVGTRA
jgi:hypothetical protein